MFVFRPYGIPLKFSLTTRLKTFTLVFLRSLFLLFLFFLSMSSFISTPSMASDAPLSESTIKQIVPLVVVHKETSVQTLSLKKLRAIFAMKLRYWEEDKPISVFVLAKDNPIHAAFCKRILNIFPNQLESVWYRQVYTGTGQAPIEVASESELIERVKNMPGAIGYIKNNNEIIKRFSNEIKIINID